MNSCAFNSAIAKSWGTKTKAIERLAKIFLDNFPFLVVLFDFSNNAKINPGVLWPFEIAQYNF